MEKKFNIEGMTCSACQAHVQKAVEKLDGLTYVNVNLLKNTMDVKYDESIVNDDIIKSAVTNAGYKAYLANEQINTVKVNNKDNKGIKLIKKSNIDIKVNTSILIKSKNKLPT